jgi:hypothetical protein
MAVNVGSDLSFPSGQWAGWPMDKLTESELTRLGPEDVKQEKPKCSTSAVAHKHKHANDTTLLTDALLDMP